MTRRARQLAESGIYHVMLRGINREPIFLEVDDFDRFLLSLARAKAKADCGVLAYCLMNNHVHLLMCTRTEAIGDSVRRIGVSYAGWFNRKYERAGYVFQGRFRSLPVEDDPYFATVLRYIWSNPVRAGIVADPRDYRWNSCSTATPAGLCDVHEVDAFLPLTGRAQLSEPLQQHLDLSEPRGRKRAIDIAEAAGFLTQSCGARSADEFALLNRDVQRRVVCELRTRQVTYSVLATVTGLARSTLHRMRWSASSQCWDDVALAVGPRFLLADQLERKRSVPSVSVRSPGA